MHGTWLRWSTEVLLQITTRVPLSVPLTLCCKAVFWGCEPSQCCTGTSLLHLGGLVETVDNGRSSFPFWIGKTCSHLHAKLSLTRLFSLPHGLCISNTYEAIWLLTLYYQTVLTKRLKHLFSWQNMFERWFLGTFTRCKATALFCIGICTKITCPEKIHLSPKTAPCNKFSYQTNEMSG